MMRNFSSFAFLDLSAGIDGMFILSTLFLLLLYRHPLCHSMYVQNATLRSTPWRSSGTSISHLPRTEPGTNQSTDEEEGMNTNHICLFSYPLVTTRNHDIIKDETRAEASRIR